MKMKFDSLSVIGVFSQWIGRKDLHGIDFDDQFIMGVLIVFWFSFDTDLCSDSVLVHLFHRHSLALKKSGLNRIRTIRVFDCSDRHSFSGLSVFAQFEDGSFDKNHSIIFYIFESAGLIGRVDSLSLIVFFGELLRILSVFFFALRHKLIAGHIDSFLCQYLITGRDGIQKVLQCSCLIGDRFCIAGRLIEEDDLLLIFDEFSIIEIQALTGLNIIIQKGWKASNFILVFKRQGDTKATQCSE